MWIDRVAVEVDGNASSRRAAEWAARHLAPRSGIVLVHAAADGEAAPGWIAGMVEREGGRVRLVRRRGDPAEVLGAAAFAEGADLAVVPPSLRGAAERAELASPVPVIAVGEDPGGRVRTLVVLMDPTPATEAALAWAALLRDGLRASSVVPVVALEGWGDEGMRRAAWRSLWGGDPAAEERSDTLRWARRMLEAHGLPEARDHVRIGYGDPASVLAEAARATSAGLVVVASEARDPFGQALRREVLRRGEVPVLLADPDHVRPEPLRPHVPAAAPPLLHEGRRGPAFIR